MENEHLRVAINNDGTLRVLHKATGREYDGLHYVEDGGEAGHAWMHIEPARDSIVTSPGCPVEVTLEESGPLLARYRVAVTMAIPTHLEENGGNRSVRLDGGDNASSRSAGTRDMLITSLITLRKGARTVDITTRYDNLCKDHRLRALFPTRVQAQTCAVEGAFDVVEREIEQGPDSPWYGAGPRTFPMHRFVDVSHGGAGVAILNDGLREYEVTADADRAVAITLMRAYEMNLTTVSKRWEPHPEMDLTQCLGAHEFRYAIYPHAGTWDAAEVYREAERLTVGLEPAQVGAHGGDLPKRKSFLSIEPANLILSAAKQSEDGKSVALRVFNPTASAVNGTITLAGGVAAARLATLEEVPGETLAVSDGRVALSVGPKKIVTVLVEMT
jgi:alpha-mannosidase